MRNILRYESATTELPTPQSLTVTTVVVSTALVTVNGYNVEAQ